MSQAPLTLWIEDEDGEYLDAPSTVQQYPILDLLKQETLPVIGQVDLICTDPYYFRVMMEILSDLTTTGKFKFYGNGLCMSHTNTDKTVSVMFTIPESGLQRYSRVFDKEYTNQYPESSYVSARVNLRRIVQIFKAYVKKDQMTITAEIRKTGRIVEMYCQSCDDDYDKMPCDTENESDDNTDVADMINKHYPNSKPACKITVGRLSTALNKYKTTQCGIMTFTLMDDWILIAGLRDGVTIGATKCPLNGKGPEEFTGQGPQDHEISSGGSSVIISDYSVTVNYGKCLTWMTKIGRLSYPNSIISMYMREGAPVILTSNIATMGMAMIAFRNDANCK